MTHKEMIDNIEFNINYLKKWQPKEIKLIQDLENKLALIKMVDDIFAKFTMKEWKEKLADSDLVFSSVQTPVEALADPQAEANNVIEKFNHPIWGEIELLPAPQKFTETPGTYRTPAPEWGQHTEEILQELGYTWDDIESFKNKHVIA